jgi:D-xylose 1-dehydrogenase (NADP+, D-xylono-1,5-lactone-forming)
MSVSWGLLSTAAINDRVLPGLARSEQVRVVAVASRDAAKVQAYAAERGIPRAHSSYDALLADPQVEAVYVNLPNSLHTEWTLRALEAGKHVLCEKPMTPRAADVERVFELARRRDLQVMEGFMYRHNPQTLKLAELVGAGAVGAVQLIRSSFRFRATDSDDIRLSPALEGGSLMDVGAYCVNITRLVAGEPTHLYGEEIAGPSGVDVRFSGILRFATDVIGLFDAAVSLPAHAEIEIFGEEGSLFVKDPWLCGHPRIEIRRNDTVEHINVEAADSYRLEFENFSAAVHGRADVLIGYDDAVGQARTIEALFRSARERRSIAP